MMNVDYCLLSVHLQEADSEIVSISKVIDGLNLPLIFAIDTSFRDWDGSNLRIKLG